MITVHLNIVSHTQRDVYRTTGCAIWCWTVLRAHARTHTHTRARAHTHTAGQRGEQNICWYSSMAMYSHK